MELEIRGPDSFGGVPDKLKWLSFFPWLRGIAVVEVLGLIKAF